MLEFLIFFTAHVSGKSATRVPDSCQAAPNRVPSVAPRNRQATRLHSAWPAHHRGVGVDHAVDGAEQTAIQATAIVIRELYRQQRLMDALRIHHIEDRIVSIHQPHIRPIVRGKAKAKVEFGAKVSVSMVHGYAFLERRQWDNFNEGAALIASVEAYKSRFGVYPKEVLADQIYRNRENRAYCKARGIRLSGPPLGRPSKQTDAAEIKRIARQDACERNAIEANSAIGKRKYGWNRMRARLEQTSGAVIALQFLVMNLERRLRLLLSSFATCC